MRAASWIIVAALAVGVGLNVSRQRARNQELAHRLAAGTVRSAEARRLAEERERLVAAQISPAELARRQEERAALTRLMLELESVRRRARANAANTVAPDHVARTAPSITAEEVAAEAWTNRGTDRPDATLETFLWAAAGGDLETMTRILLLDDAARARAEAIFARLPAGARSEMVSPERLVALLTAQAVPLGSARVLRQDDQPGESVLAVQLRNPAGATRELRITVRERDDGNWGLMVPASAVDQLGNGLKPPAAGPKSATVPAAGN